MKRQTVKDMVLTHLRKGECSDIELQAALKPTAPHVVNTAVLKLRASGLVQASHAATQLRLTP